MLLPVELAHLLGQDRLVELRLDHVIEGFLELRLQKFLQLLVPVFAHRSISLSHGRPTRPLKNMKDITDWGQKSPGEAGLRQSRSAGAGDGEQAASLGLA